MSAYMVDDITIDRILSGIPQYAPPLADTLGLCPETADAVGCALLLMNRSSVEQHDAADDTEAASAARKRNTAQAVNYRYTCRIGVSLEQWVKSLRCYLYQCGEGDVPTTMPYQQLEAAAQAYEHVLDTETYEEAEWR